MPSPKQLAIYTACGLLAVWLAFNVKAIGNVVLPKSS